MGKCKTKSESKKQKEYNAVSWLKEHPEDIPMARENLAARDRGYDNDAVRRLFAAISLRACMDYKRAVNRARVGDEKARDAVEECREFFDSDIFGYFINRIPVPEIEKTIRSIPDITIETLVKKIK